MGAGEKKNQIRPICSLVGGFERPPAQKCIILLYCGVVVKSFWSSSMNGRRLNHHRLYAFLNGSLSNVSRLTTGGGSETDIIMCIRVRARASVCTCVSECVFEEWLNDDGLSSFAYMLYALRSNNCRLKTKKTCFRKWKYYSLSSTVCHCYLQFFRCGDFFRIRLTISGCLQHAATRFPA